MFGQLSIIAALMAAPAWAEDPPPPPPAEQAHASLAEARRLQGELRALAKKNAWAGVDRAFRDLEQTGVMLEYDDFLVGAHAARALGDVGMARARLRRCLAIREEKEIVDWLWEIDENYGAITLRGDVGRVRLVPEVTPFDPVAAQAITYAVAQVQEKGEFDGYLPAGRYEFGGVELEVRPRLAGELVDLRTTRRPRNRGGRRK